MLLKSNSQVDPVDALFLKPLHADSPPWGIFRRAVGEVETRGRGSGVGRGVSGAPSKAALWAFRANQPTNLSLVWGGVHCRQEEGIKLSGASVLLLRAEILLYSGMTVFYGLVLGWETS